MSPLFMIWSFEHESWWAPGRNGYVEDWQRAGLYEFDEAIQIVNEANVVRLEESMVPISCVRFWKGNKP